MLSDEDLPSAASVAAVVDEVTYGLLGVGTSASGDGTTTAGWWACSLGIGAPAELELVLRCPEAFARRVADAMVGPHGDEVNDALVRESLAEFTSIVGGNLKSLVKPLSCAPLASPQVGAPSPGDERVVVSLRCGAEPLRISLIPRATQP